ncbi:con-10 family general stress protein [Sediminicoccus rosea]|jgi:general stress protein YciG|uniref:KGG domain-containing protein n=1 Tax=Sediminicoccus rosea TaxID=1225128 RepID=A0ABZ0PJI5_9PROT|nr:KGG domain-containing protein [Sediminicoccus rosea]WPB85890.1 KGG domain-containing protein [Sediminicoccus rosea]
MSDKPKQGRSARGFAAMDEKKRQEIASKGGQSVAPERRSFSKDPELAAQAGRKGGKAVAPEDRSFSKDPELAAEAGRKGGEASHGGRGRDAGGAPGRGGRS